VIRRLLREPLVTFVVLGLGLFWLYGQVVPQDASHTIRLSTADVDALRTDHQRRFGTEPTAEDDRAIVAHYVDDEILYREALALGLDRGDIIVRRRLLQKMEFLLDGLHPVPEPTDADLEAYLAAHTDRYRTPARIDLVHVFVSRDRHGADANAMALRLRAELVRGADPAVVGDPFLRGRVLREQSEQDLAGIFGPAFARVALELPTGEWSEPVTSSYGLHVVRVSKRSPAELPPLAVVRAAVRQDWSEERRDAARKSALDELRGKYDVRVESAPVSTP